MINPVFNQALASLERAPEPKVDGMELRRALANYQIDSVWSVVAAQLKASPGSHSHKNYFSAFKDFITWAEREQFSLTAPVAHFGPEYLDYLREKYGASQASINTRLSQARRFYKIFRQLGVVPVNLDPFSILERIQVLPGQHRDYYSAEEISRLLAHASMPDQALVLIGAHAGLTTAEVLALTWTDCSFTEGSLTLSVRQNRISDELYMSLQQLSAQQGGGALFTSLSRVFDFADQNALRARIYTLCRTANVDYRARRGLRHAAGLRCYQQTRNLEEVARFLGVENHHLVRVYQDVSESAPNEETVE